MVMSIRKYINSMHHNDGHTFLHIYYKLNNDEHAKVVLACIYYSSYKIVFQWNH